MTYSDDFIKPEERKTEQMTPTVAEPAEIPARVDMSWWKSPAFVEREKALQEEGKAIAKRQERQLKRERNAALIGDMARLFAQGYAKKGGVYKIDRMQPYSAAANERLRQLRDNNAALAYRYAERMQQAADKDRQDSMAKEQTRMSLQQKADAMAAEKQFNQQKLEQAKEEAKAKAEQQRIENLREDRKLAETERSNKAMEAIRRADVAGRGSSRGGKEEKDRLRVKSRKGGFVEFPYSLMGVKEAYKYVTLEDPSLIKQGKPIMGGRDKEDIVGYEPISEQDMWDAIREYERKQEEPEPTTSSSKEKISFRDALRNRHEDYEVVINTMPGL